VAVPAGFRDDGLPFGITLLGRAWTDEALLRLADRFHRVSVEHAGALGTALPAATGAPVTLARAEALPSAATSGQFIAVAVCGAHMEGLPLNHQLASRGATFVRRTRTIASYKFYALPGGPPFRPGLVRVPAGGASVDVEVWSVPAEQFGSFVAGIPAPLGIGKVDLEDGQQVSGFLCEAHAVEGARDITDLGGWRQYLRTR
jgi:allophanate hydrolase